MALHDRDYWSGERTQVSEATVSSFATRVYGWMTMGLLITAAVALWIYNSGTYAALMPFWWVATFGTFGIAMAMGFMVQRLPFPALAVLFTAYSALQGMLFGIILPIYAAAYGGQMIWLAFGTAGTIFGIAMCYGIVTKTDLTGIGKILRIALMGLIAVTFLYIVMSFFVTLTMFDLIICYLGLIIFIGLTAYDAQQIRRMSSQTVGHSELAGKLSLIMALKMYINVIMIFWYILRIFSAGRR
ncbi:MAG: Bax inhibitor-1/YccA family protein [Waddliaceae bacterium]|jgi:uncharacterized protein|nr:Bax inhibitor-1/YccA family protein [Waddliaceae bacterium]MBT3578419.1 Bax inhibitor-1/YccA family protein [Waddliaceae bacterium]MBT4445271.1 Bax inhibitor-1/YccA family protein [Waddliaceae bacterium]MBT6929131.1 Bax inhibitor-1/YccA family protein [Waddliaceae bacterium]MBT7264630.1 Bax inhibitor-1/YccA family protein [Waddliaceae bacterium]